VSRGALVTLLFVVAGLLIPFALVGVWTHQVLLDRDRFVHLSDDLLSREAVRQGLADQIIGQLERTRARTVAGEPALRPGITGALGSPEYRSVFEQALGGVHDQLTRDDDTVRLDVGPAVDLAHAQLARSNARLANSLPPGSQVPPVVVARRNQVPVLWGAVDAAQRIAVLTPLLVLGLLALAVVMARRRWLTLGVAGAVVAGVSLLLLGLLALAKQGVGRGLDHVVSRDAFDAAWDVIARSLANETLIIVVGAIVVGAGGIVVDQILTRRPAS
jgi:hypothetical protein